MYNVLVLWWISCFSVCPENSRRYRDGDYSSLDKPQLRNRLNWRKWKKGTKPDHLKRTSQC